MVLCDAGACRGVCFSVCRDPFDLAAEHTALGIELVDRHAHATQVVLAAVAVLPARIAGQADFDGLLGALRQNTHVLPGAEEGCRC